MTDSQTVLIVDDTLVISMALAEMLKMEGFTAQIANNGNAALTKIDKQPPDLILLDIQMPGIDGFEVCRRLKANDKTNGIPIIFVSGTSNSQDRITGLELGAVDFITKPFHLSEVLSQVKNSIEKKRQIGVLKEQITEVDKTNAHLSS